MSNRGAGMFDETMLAMLQYIVKSNFAGQVFTLEDVEEARRIAHAHFSGHPKSFNYEGFKSLYAKHGGRLPLRIRAVKEGTVVKSLNALITIENTDPEFYWLTNWAETVLPAGLVSHYCCNAVARDQASDWQELWSARAILLCFPSSCTTLGFRGVSSKESAAIGGAAHLFNFLGTDTLAAIQLLNQFYSSRPYYTKTHSTAPVIAIPASEHSTITAWGEANEGASLRQHP